MATSVTITGSGSPGPPADRAGPGGLVRCDGPALQFDAGRATTMRLAAGRATTMRLDAGRATTMRLDAERAAGREPGPPAGIGPRRRPRSYGQFIDAQMSSLPSYSFGTTDASSIDSQSGFSS